MPQAAPDSPPDRRRIADLLLRLRADDPGAEAGRYEQIYADLRGLARAQVRREQPDHSLGTTGLVHYLAIRPDPEPEAATEEAVVRARIAELAH